ncbi:MAG: transposase [Lachnospiraceae bacterium]|nr:transposase [Lachnospiraceae bacterium]MBQ3515511.1 transposase [Lachnospiraceae bacterium]
MLNSTTNTYTLKREILTFSNKISKHLSKPDKKFSADMIYGMLASKSCMLTDIVEQLHENTKKINSVERLSRHLEKGISQKATVSYLQTIKKWVPDEPVIHIDDSDVTKPDGYKFEALGIVRDGSESTSTKNVYKKGYHVTEACVLTKSNHPVSIFSRIHSSSEKDYKSANAITFEAMEQGAALFEKATFAMDRGYDDNKMFLKMEELKQDYVIRLKSNRKLLYHNKWTMATELRNRRKGKVKTSVYYKGKEHEAYLSHVKVQITASRKDIYLVLVYGITEHPMMLATNKEIKSKEDVIKVARIYFSRWKIEEYFRCKKQMFQFENFRVRKLVSINALNFYITLCMAFLAHISMKPETNALKVLIIQKADPIKEKVYFCYYRLAKGISGILSYAKEGVRLWFRTKRPAYRQLCLKLTV